MPSLKSIRRRIASVKNTRKITRAMKLVAAAKLRRAQDSIIAARPYTNALAKVVGEIAGASGTDAHPLFVERPTDRAAIVVFTSDRGLAGAFNSSIIKRVEQFAAGDLAGCSEVSLRIIGKKANQHFVRRNANIASFDLSPTGANALQLARETANRVISDFTSAPPRVDKVYVAYNEFKTPGSQTVVIKQILPVVPPTEAEAGAAPADLLFEATPDATLEDPTARGALLNRLLPLYVQIGLYRAGLESIASELGARMMAMENATKNAGEMISKLTLQYNRARQASITKELAEIVGGAEALKG
jgi:F-type H+-transporting ATPase subunit gamma